MLASLLLGLALWALAGGLLWLHLRARGAAERGNLNERDLKFARGQFARRLQVCVLLALIGTAIICGPLMTNPLLSLGYWSCVVLLICGMVVLALLDLRGSQRHFQTLEEEQAAEFAALRAELVRHLPPDERDAAPELKK
jgi:hypothetical protein